MLDLLRQSLQSKPVRHWDLQQFPKFQEDSYFVRVYYYYCCYYYIFQLKGRAMAQAVSSRPLTAEARVRSRVNPCGICGGQSSTGTGISPSASVFPCQFHSTGALLHGKIKKTNNLYHRVAPSASRLRCVRSIYCGPLQKKILQLIIDVEESTVASVRMLRYSQRYGWRLRPSGIWRRVTVPSVSEKRSTFIFSNLKVRVPFLSSWV
jgi:hypothetical protein